jgi:hypothetical protein
MTPAQADEGLLELGLPDGGCVLIAFVAEASGDPDLECSILQTMLAAGDTEADVRSALTAYAAEAGLPAVVSTSDHPTTVTIG